MSFNEYKEVAIEEICSIKRGASPRPIIDYISETGIPWVKISDATAANSRYINSTGEFIKEEGKSKSRFVEKGTLILSNSATPGIPKVMGINACVHDGWLIIDDFNGVKKEYMYYAFINERDKLLNLSNGSVFRNLKTDIVKKYKIRIPEITEQQQIIKVLSTLDEKIEINNQINKKLEEMAQAIFKHWFVDFEFPNENGEAYKSSGGEMVESDMGMIPGSWKVNKISEIADMKNGVNYGRGQEGEEIKVINVRDFDGSLLVNDSKLDNVFLSEKQIKDYLVKKFDTVVVRSAKPGETLLVPNNERKVYSGFTIRVRALESILKLYMFYSLRNAMKHLESSSNGTVFKNLNQQILGSLKISIPNLKAIKDFNCIIEPIVEKILIVTDENNRLVKMRELLLPKLMSGEIRVPLENIEQ